MSTAVDEHVETRFETYLDDLFELLAQPSISATSEGVAECTELVETVCRRYGFDDVKTVETPGQPCVIAHADAGDDTDGAPTVLLYGHYDVQPVDPTLWDSPPFEPTVREGPDGTERIYARGAGDNKGQWFSHVCAVEAIHETGTLPVNVTLLLEGEEESSSPNLGHVVEEYTDELTADLAYVADGPIDPSGRPHVLMGARGLLYVQIDAEGPNRDLHSGNYGGPVSNPAWELVRLLSSMMEDGTVAIDGFYDDVREITDQDREVLDAMPFDTDAMLTDLGVDGFAEGPGETYLEKVLYYPTLNVPGFESGYTGEGTKTIIPSTASVKLDMRLVADQDPDDIYRKFERHVDAHTSGIVDLDIVHHGSMKPQRTPLDSPVVEPVLDAVSDAWGVEPILKPSLGGSLPTYVFDELLDTPCVVVPYANADENNHSPNENLSVRCFRDGIRTTARVLTNLRTSL